VHEEAATAGSV